LSRNDHGCIGIVDRQSLEKGPGFCLAFFIAAGDSENLSGDGHGWTLEAAHRSGHLERVVISHDICYKTRLTSFGGHGYPHIFENIFPLMRSRGFSEAEIEGILVGNPRRLLTFV